MSVKSWKFSMVFIPIVVIASIGILSSILKLVIDHHHNRTGFHKIDSISSHPVANLSLIIEGTELMFPYYSQSTQIVRTAVDFCSQHGEQFGFTLRTSADCVDQIVEAINTLKEAGSDISTWVLEFKRSSVEGNGNSQFILEAQQIDMKPSTETNENKYAMVPLVKLPYDIIDTIKINLDINGVIYLFEVNRIYGEDPESIASRFGAANRLAIDFCRLRGVELGIISSEDSKTLHEEHLSPDSSITRYCIVPLRNALVQRMEAKQNEFHELMDRKDVINNVEYLQVPVPVV